MVLFCATTRWRLFKLMGLKSGLMRMACFSYLILFLNDISSCVVLAVKRWFSYTMCCSLLGPARSMTAMEASDMTVVCMPTVSILSLIYSWFLLSWWWWWLLLCLFLLVLLLFLVQEVLSKLAAAAIFFFFVCCTCLSSAADPPPMPNCSVVVLFRIIFRSFLRISL